jgi:hypothetical protein
MDGDLTHHLSCRLARLYMLELELAVFCVCECSSISWNEVSSKVNISIICCRCSSDGTCRNRSAYVVRTGGDLSDCIVSIALSLPHE